MTVGKTQALLFSKPGLPRARSRYLRSFAGCHLAAPFLHGRRTPCPRPAQLKKLRPVHLDSGTPNGSCLSSQRQPEVPLAPKVGAARSGPPKLCPPSRDGTLYSFFNSASLPLARGITKASAFAHGGKLRWAHTGVRASARDDRKGCIARYQSFQELRSRLSLSP